MVEFLIIEITRIIVNYIFLLYFNNISKYSIMLVIFIRFYSFAIQVAFRSLGTCLRLMTEWPHAGLLIKTDINVHTLQKAYLLLSNSNVYIWYHTSILSWPHTPTEHILKRVTSIFPSPQSSMVLIFFLLRCLKQ